MPGRQRAIGAEQRLTQAISSVERLQALLEELRVRAPGSLTGEQLAARLGVSQRTIERDVTRLQEAGVPIAIRRGRGGGYAFDAPNPLAPIALSPAEAGAIITSLVSVGPYVSASARSALDKVLAAVTQERASAPTRDP
jgi:predicted DNA-binding transcriptional regulator YafY